MQPARGEAADPAGDVQIGDVRSVYDGRLWPDIQVDTFRNIDRLFPTRTVHRGESVRALPRDLVDMEDFVLRTGGRTYDLYDILSLNRVSGIVIVQGGAIRFEKYLLGNDEDTRWMSMSVVKSMTASLIGAAVHDGLIGAIDDPIVDYLPELRGSAYDGVTVEHLLTMTSGVDWNETYTDPGSDRRRMLDLQIAQEPGAILRQMAALDRAAEPGTRWNYSTGETHVAGALVRAAAGMPLADYLSEKIWGPMGMESDATWWLESPGGLEVGGSGLSATLRDYARFGLFLLHDGVIDGERVLPEGWMAEAGTGRTVAGEPVEYGYMLWPLDRRSYAAIGIFGQFVYVDPDRDLVVAMWSAQPKPVGGEVVDEYAFLAALSDWFAPDGRNRPAAGADNGSEAEARAALARLLDEFLAGASVNDRAAHDRFWAEDLVYTSSAGERFGKADIMAGFDSPAADDGEGTGMTYRAEDVNIRVYGDTAVVAFRLLGQSGDASGGPEFFNTGTFRLADGGWRAVAWQATRIPGDEPPEP